MSELPNPDLLEELAEKLIAIGQKEKSSVLLYAEGGDNWAGGSIFVERPDAIVWISPRDGFLKLVMRLWNEAPSNKKWRGIAVFVEGDEFRAEFDYGEGWSDEEDEGDRREPVARAHFGDKPISYPPLEGAEPWE